jgi:hypothetical protein
MCDETAHVDACTVDELWILDSGIVAVAMDMDVVCYVLCILLSLSLYAA